MSEGTVQSPVYRAVLEADSMATKRYMIVCDEGWRESIVCEGMYRWAADWLVEILQGRTYPPGPGAGATIGSTYRTAAVRDGLSQHGHGHVVLRFDGSKARCGGPAICATCAKDAAALQQAEQSNAAPC